jgi:ABC-type multidrug transport system ATPase subunit/pSer/pThr/pTyr-binding forkhead associated (FHA) protein/ABC-type multidrug transport system permease subunit
MDVVNRPPSLASIQFLTGPLAGNSIQISKTTITIGREPGNDVVISDPTVSRQHARLVYNGSQWSVEKLNPQNTLAVNRREVQQTVINDRDTISIGPGTSFLFISGAGTKRPVPPPPPPIQSQQVPFPSPQQPFNAQSWPQQQPQVVASSPAPMPTVAAPPPRQGQPGGGTQASLFTAGNEVSAGTANIRGVPSLEISSNVHRDKQAFPLTKQVINIGRDPSNDIVINELVVSGFHAQIVREGNQFVFVHPHPTRQSTLNGLLYQGQHIQGNAQFRKPLARGDIFRIGDEHGTLVTLTFNDGSGAPQDIAPEIRPIPLGAAVITIGRLPSNNVVLNHPQVSGQHARLEQVQGGYRIIDMGSTNHVYVNAQRVTHQLLKPGDEVRIGPFKLTYTGTQLTQHDESNSIRIDALHLKKVGNRQTILINDISIAVPPRKFVALVGGSGAGKSTLMDALNGLRPAQQGAVLYNGQDYYRHLAAFSTQLGYVPQEDIIHRDLTVERALYYAAKMRLPEDFTAEQVKQRIDEVLDDVEMKYRRHLLVSKLSGGQRKRVSIALELLANPSVFFLDEPTSGLDPGLDRKMMFLLRKLADKGHTIVLVTHATNNINACDYVCFLCQGGRLAYYGPPDEAKTYFGKTDFAEIYSALEPTDENPNIPAQVEDKFRTSPDFQKYVVEPLNQGPAGRANVQQQTVDVRPPKRGNPWKQFWFLFMRYGELLKNDTVTLLFLLLQAPVIALILYFLAAHDVFNPTNVVTCPPNPQHPVPVTAPSHSKFDCQNVVIALNTPQGQAFLQQNHLTADQALQQSIAPGSGGNAQKILFIMAFAAIMFGCINGTGAIVREAAIYRRERAVNLGIAPYMFSKIVVLGLLCLLQSAVLVLVVNGTAPFQHSVFLPPILEIYITMALTSIAGLMLGLTVSAVAPNNDRAASLIPIILIPQLIFSGIIFALDNPGLQFLGAFFAARWSMAGLGSTIGLHGEALGSGKDYAYRGTLFSSYTQSEAIVHLLLMWLALVVMSVAFTILIAYFLKRKDIRK